MLTKKQEKVLRFIETRVRTHGSSPTIREIANHFKFSSTGTVRDYIKVLLKKGLLSYTPKVARGIEVVGNRLFKIPILGRIRAGMPHPTHEDIEGHIDFKEFSISNEIFALRVKGDSMVDAGIFEGDLALIKKTPLADNGNIVVALIEDEATIKRFYREKDRVRLEPANKDYSPIYASRDFRIIGKVISLIRKYN